MQTIELAKALHALDVYDLSPLFETNMPGYMLDPIFGVIQKAKNVEQQYYNTQIIVFGEHNGSHVDAPVYKLPGTKSIDKYPAAYLIAPYKKLDLRAFHPEAGKSITAAQLEETLIRDNLKIEEGDIVLLEYGWDRHYLPDTQVLFRKDWWAANVPGLSEDAMRFLAEKKIKAVGSDTVTPDAAYTDSDWSYLPGREQYFLPNDILMIGGLIGMAEAPNRGLFMTAPLKIKDGSGSPIRPLLLDDRGSPELYDALKALTAYDISPTFENNMPGFFNHPTLGVVSDARDYEKYGFYSQTLIMCEHNGSHTDSYSHIHNHLDSMEKIPSNHFIGPYKKYDLTAFDTPAGQNATLAQILEVERRDGITAEEDDIVLLQFGWDKWYDPESRDIEKLKKYSFGPGIDEDTVRYFSEKKIRSIGADVVSADMAFPFMPGHLEYFLPKGILIMESFVNMSDAPAQGIFAAFPWKIKDGSGCPMSPILFG
ncbi:MAG: cyclase family protein [Clostridiales Family XIII bacterium]|jgi:DNA-directed RNA polymerase III subunit RPC1|nr:cyclase family protein [Clostridiales Family XIII bacterium]